MPPPPAEPLATRIFLGPALRTQPDRRLVKLVREGYEAAFEEIVRRYRKPLDRFARGLRRQPRRGHHPGRLLEGAAALRGSGNEIELRPWLYRIVRNTALNDLRDQPRGDRGAGRGDRRRRERRGRGGAAARRSGT